MLRKGMAVDTSKGICGITAVEALITIIIDAIIIISIVNRRWLDRLS